MNLEWIEIHPNQHVAVVFFESPGVRVTATAKVFLGVHGYVIHTGIGGTVQIDGGRLNLDEAKELAKGLLEQQLQILQEQIQKALKDSADFGEVQPDGG